MVDLGTLSPVKARDVWSGESREFTPWLAENADLLGEALGMDLVHERTEAAVGRYSADLVFREASRSELVVVENMFGSTDHDHLGKLNHLRRRPPGQLRRADLARVPGRASVRPDLAQLGFQRRFRVLRRGARSVAHRRLAACTPTAGRSRTR